MNTQDKLAAVVLGGGARRSTPVMAPVEGVVRSVGPDGVRFAVPSWDDETHVFGPAKWNRGATTPAGDPAHTHEPGAPPVGADCLVVFVGSGIDRAWVVAWW